MTLTLGTRKNQWIHFAFLLDKSLCATQQKAMSLKNNFKLNCHICPIHDFFPNKMCTNNGHLVGASQKSDYHYFYWQFNNIFPPKKVIPCFWLRAGIQKWWPGDHDQCQLKSLVQSTFLHNSILCECSHRCLSKILSNGCDSSYCAHMAIFQYS